MNLKKFLSRTVCLLFIISAIFGFVACDTTTTSNDNGLNLADGSLNCDDANAVWSLAFINVKAQSKISMTQSDGSYTAIYDGSILYVKSLGISTKNEYWYEQESSTYIYCYCVQQDLSSGDMNYSRSRIVQSSMLQQFFDEVNCFDYPNYAFNRLFNSATVNNNVTQVNFNHSGVYDILKHTVKNNLITQIEEIDSNTTDIITNKLYNIRYNGSVSSIPNRPTDVEYDIM